MEIIKFNAFDTNGKLVYCSYRKIETGKKSPAIERSLPFDKFIEQEPKLGEILEGACYYLYLEEDLLENKKVYEKKFIDETPDTDLTEEEIDYFKSLVLQACLEEKWDDLLKPPSVDEQVEDFIKEFFDEQEEEEGQSVDYLEEFFKELEEEEK